MTQVNLLDCMLRDGGYYSNWDFPIDVVSDYLEAMSAYTFLSHEILSAYAVDKGAVIINRSIYSLIDAYLRSGYAEICESERLRGNSS